MEAASESLNVYICPELTILPELRDHLPGVPKTTDAELERQLLDTYGAVDVIWVWKGRNIITDGHRRYKFCKKHNLPFVIREREYADIQAVKDWMDSWIGSRRHLTPPELAQLLARRFECLRKNFPGRSANLIAEEIAKEQGVSRVKVLQASKQAKALKLLPEDLRVRITSGEIRLSQEDLFSLCELGELHQRSVFEDWDTGEYKSFHEVLNGQGKASDEGDLEEFEPEPTTEETLETTSERANDTEIPEQAGESEQDPDDAAPWEDDEANGWESYDHQLTEPNTVSGEPKAEPAAIKPPKARTPRPSNKPVCDMLAVMEKHLGKLNTILFDLQDQNPKMFVKCRTAALELSTQIIAWQKETR